MAKQFEVHGTMKNPWKSVVIEAETAEEAVLKFKESLPEYDAITAIDEDSNDHSIEGWCESTGRPIFEGMAYKQDEDGIMWLED
jgi:hypothetical protein